MSKILGLDFETQGLSAQTDRVTEAGLVLYDSATKQPVRISGFLVKVPGGVSAEITRITGITNAMLDAYGVESRVALQAILNMAKLCDYFLAHNGNDFDKPFLEAWCKRENLLMPEQFWLDTKLDLPVEAYEKGSSMFIMAAHHGFLYDAHRAVSDVLATFKVLGHYDINRVIERAKMPTLYVRAVVSYEDRLLAKERGFHWRPEAKLWVKGVKPDELDLEKELCKFPVVQMESACLPS